MPAGGDVSNNSKEHLKLLEDLETSLILADSLNLSMTAIHIQTAIEALRAQNLKTFNPARPGPQSG
jgi:hypothetical protein